MTPQQQVAPSAQHIAGRELDALVAERVMRVAWFHEPELIPCPEGRPGCLVAHHRTAEPPHYSTDISAAWQVVEKMRERGYEVCIGLISDGVFCRIDDEPGVAIGRASVDWRDGSTPLAICLAALKAVAASGNPELRAPSGDSR